MLFQSTPKMKISKAIRTVEFSAFDTSLKTDSERGSKASPPPPHRQQELFALTIFASSWSHWPQIIFSFSMADFDGDERTRISKWWTDCSQIRCYPLVCRANERRWIVPYLDLQIDDGENANFYEKITALLMMAWLRGIRSKWHKRKLIDNPVTINPCLPFNTCLFQLHRQERTDAAASKSFPLFILEES